MATSTTTPTTLVGLSHPNVTEAQLANIFAVLDGVLVNEAPSIYSIDPTANTLKILTYGQLGLTVLTAIFAGIAGLTPAPAPTA